MFCKHFNPSCLGAKRSITPLHLGMDLIEERIVLVVSNGRTGRHVVRELLEDGFEVRVIARSPEKFSDATLEHNNLRLIEGSVLRLTDQELAAWCGCGHCLVPAMWDEFGGDVRGAAFVYGSTRRPCEAVDRNGANKTTKFVLMNSMGVDNPNKKAARWLDRGVLNVLSHHYAASLMNWLRWPPCVGEGHPNLQWCVFDRMHSWTKRSRST